LFGSLWISVHVPLQTASPAAQPHVPAVQASPAAHATQARPPLPHALPVVPARQAPDEQQPVQELVSHVHAPLAQRSPAPQLPVWQTPPHPSSAPQAVPEQLGVHPHVPLDPPPPHVKGEAHCPPAQHACPLPPHAPQLVPHVCPVLHEAQVVPPCPQAALLVPGSHVVPEQHPVHDVGSHSHTPPAQCCPVAHDPAAHVPPQPSSAPHAFPLQSGAQPHRLLCPPPPHVSGAPQAPLAQQGCPLPPHVPQSPVPHACPLEHAAHATPPVPHAAASVPGRQALPLQHPVHEVASQWQVPPTQRWPCSHEPVVHVPLHPSLCPQAFPAQLGWHAPAPQMLGAPPPPQVCPTAQPPQEITFPQRPAISPHFFVQSAASSGVQLPVAPSTPACESERASIDAADASAVEPAPVFCPPSHPARHARRTARGISTQARFIMSSSLVRAPAHEHDERGAFEDWSVWAVRERSRRAPGSRRSRRPWAALQASRRRPWHADPPMTTRYGLTRYA
jgi:hypothetical protein